MDLVTVIVNGKEIEVPPGTLAIEAVKQAGFAIGHFCYHPKLRPVGQCRMCLAQVGTPAMGPDRQPVLNEDGTPQIRFFPKPMATCTMPVSPGMVINTETEECIKVRKGVLELFLANHPLDCPVCDKGGECMLQDQTMAFGPGFSRVGRVWSDDPIGIKRHFKKPVPLGELIALDRERCIQCGRCVRFCEEISMDDALTFVDRGADTEIGSLTDPVFDSKFSGNTCDICPVGALTSRVFRFGARVWETHNIPTVCTQCACGCHIYANERANRLVRIMPRNEDSINECWICDRGRFDSDYVNSEDRLTTPLLRRNDQLEPATWDEALGVIAVRLRQYAGEAVAGLMSPKCTVEDNYLFRKLFAEGLQSNCVDYRLDARIEHSPRRVEDFYEQVESADAIVLVGIDLLEQQPILDLRVKKCVSKNGGALITIRARRTPIDMHATATLLHRPGAAASVVNALCRQLLEGADEEVKSLPGFEECARSLQGAEAGDAGPSAETIAAAAEKLRTAERPLVLYADDCDPATRAASRNLAALAGAADQAFCIAAHANDLGCALVQERVGAADADVDSILAAAAEGKVKALYIMGQNPVISYRDGATIRKALEQLEFLVVQDIFLSATAEQADVVLPACSAFEKEGTVVNLAGVAQSLQQALKPIGDSQPDWRILTRLANALDLPWRYRSAAEVADEIGELPFAGAPAAGLTAVMPELPPAAGEERPFLLTTGPLLYDGSETLRHTRHLSRLVPEPFVELHRDDAERLGVTEGWTVAVESAAGTVEVTAKVGGNVLPGVVFMPCHLPGVAANTVTAGAAATPVNVRPLREPEQASAEPTSVYELYEDSLVIPLREVTHADSA